MTTDPGGSPRRPSETIAADIRARIVSGALKPGDRVPSTRMLVREHGVASATAARALALLRSDGWIETLDRSGSVVTAGAGGPTGRGDAGPVSYDAVVTEAIALADEEGFAAVTVRRLALRLHVPTVRVTSLLRGHGPLTHAMIAAVVSRPPVPARRAGWRARLTQSAQQQWLLYRNHPWLAQVLSLTRPQPVPELLALGERDLESLEDVEADPVARFDLYVAFTAYVRGMAVDLTSEQQAETDTGIDADTWTTADPTLSRTLAVHAGPALQRVGDYPYDVDRIFRRGLACLLDGLAERAARRQDTAQDERTARTTSTGASTETG